MQTQISWLSFILQRNKKVDFCFCHSGHSLQFSAKSAERNGCRPLWVKMGQLALSKGPAKIGIRYHVQRANIPSKGFINLILACPEYSNTSGICVSDIKERFPPVHIKNKPHARNQNMRLFLAHQSTWLHTTRHFSYSRWYSSVWMCPVTFHVCAKQAVKFSNFFTLPNRNIC
jgi:hypothetical protein